MGDRSQAEGELHFEYRGNVPQAISMLQKMKKAAETALIPDHVRKSVFVATSWQTEPFPFTACACWRYLDDCRGLGHVLDPAHNQVVLRRWELPGLPGSQENIFGFAWSSGFQVRSRLGDTEGY